MLRGILQITLEQLKIHFNWVESQLIETVEVKTHKIRLRYEKYVFLIFMIHKGSKYEKLHQFQSKMLKLIKIDAEERLASQIDEPEFLRDV